MIKGFNDNELALIWLSLAQGITPLKKREWLSNYDNPSDFYNAFTEERDYIIELIGTNSYIKLQEFYPCETLELVIKEHESRGITLLTSMTEGYPVKFNDFDDAPLCLFCKGDISLMDSEFMIAVVGTRNATRYGKDVTKKLVSELAHSKFTTISGLAKGIDTIVHAVTLDCGGKTIAVLGCGLDTMYPSENLELARKIVENGLILTEYPLGVKPFAYNFPQRNRIISGLSQAVLITEAGLKSGTLITADTAISQNIDVLVVPGSILSDQSAGANSLIADGAIMILGINDIYRKFNMKDKQTTPTNIQLDFIEQSIMDELIEDKHFDELLIKSGLTVQAIMPTLLKLELEGLIRKLPGNFYGKTVR